MKLTKSDREAFVSAVLNDIPQVDYNELAQKYVKDFLIEKMPPKIKAVYDDKELRDWLSTSYVGMPGSLQTFYFHHVNNEYRKINTVYPELAEQLVEWSDKLYEQNQVQRDMQLKLGGIINGCSTLKQAKERLPEFEKYLPKERDATGVSNLPAVSNVVAELSKLGWPKEQAAV